MIPTLTTMRLIARDFRQSDANSFYQNYAANKENHQYYSDAVYSLAKVRELILEKTAKK